MSPAAGPPACWASGFVVDGVAVGPDTDGEVRLDVTVPGDAAAGSSTIRVNARGGGAADVLPITIRVNAPPAR